jgi:hypothetical protein
MLGVFQAPNAIPVRDVRSIKIESELLGETVLFLSDIFPTGYMTAKNAVE